MATVSLERLRKSHPGAPDALRELSLEIASAPPRSTLFPGRSSLAIANAAEAPAARHSAVVPAATINELSTARANVPPSPA